MIGRTAANKAVMAWIDADPRRGLVGCTPAMIAQVAIDAYLEAVTRSFKEATTNPDGEGPVRMNVGLRRPDCTCSEPDCQDEFCPQHGRDATETPKPCICEHLAYHHTEMNRTGRLVEIPCTADGCRCPDYMPNYLTRGPL